MELCGLPQLGFLFALLILAAVIENVTRILLEDVLGWQLAADARPEQVSAFTRRWSLASTLLAVGIGIAVCWIFNIGILQWLNLGGANGSSEPARWFDYVLTGFIIGGGTRAVGAVMKATGIMPGLPFERKSSNQRTHKTTNQPAPPSLIPLLPLADTIAQLIQVDALPGLARKLLTIPPNSSGVLYTQNAATLTLEPGQHRVKWVWAREPALAAVIDAKPFTLQPTATQLTAADGETLDAMFQMQARVTDVLRFAARALDTQPLLDRRALANQLAAAWKPALNAQVQHYDTGTLLDNATARQEIARRARPALDALCAERGLEITDLMLYKFEPSGDTVQEIANLEALEGPAGQQEIQNLLTAAPNSAQAIQTVEQKAGTPDLLSAEQAKQVTEDLKDKEGVPRAAQLISQAVERKLQALNERVQDRIEQTLAREQRSTKMDKFMRRNARLVAWATRLKLLGGVMVAAIPVIEILAPDFIPEDTRLKLFAALFGLTVALVAFLFSWRLGAEYNRRKEEFDRGWLTRDSAERVLDADAIKRAEAANALNNFINTLREQRSRIAITQPPVAIQIKEVEDKANRLRQELEGAETGQWTLRQGERFSARQAQRLMDGNTGIEREAAHMTAQCAQVATLIDKTDWNALTELTRSFDATLTGMRQRFSERAIILRGNA